ncbi:MAG: D-alanine--D-alanine ligase [Gammaproteobacteria bacterium]|jgi:D-alanine-D-alanine ligase|nr:D-alanine--D-alanine ligase [Gammaproteobacteria bacterium]
MNVVVLMGVDNEEREISLKSGRAVANALSKHQCHLIDVMDSTWLESVLNLQPDCVFLALHGQGGEDGEIQKLLEQHNICYTGSDEIASRLCMDKMATIARVREAGYLVAESYLWDHEPYCEYEFPVVVKPNCSGSSVAVRIVHDGDEFIQACHEASEYGDVMIEQFIKGKDLTVPIVEGLRLSPIAIEPNSEYYDYFAKYQDSSTRYIVGANMDESLLNALIDDAENIFYELGCRHWGRADFMLTEDGQWYFLEMNTIPGMTATSLVPKSAAHCGMSFTDLVEHIIQQAILR